MWRHYVEAKVRLLSAEGGRDELDAIGEVVVRERHDLRLLGRARRVQHEREVAGLDLARRRRLDGATKLAELEEADSHSVGNELQQVDLLPVARLLDASNGGARVALHQDHRVARQVLELELHLWHGEGWVKRRKHALLADGPEAYGSFGTVRHGSANDRVA